MGKTYLETISHFSEVMREQLIKEATHTRFEQVPLDLAFLRPGLVDLGFERLGLADDDYHALLLAFVGEGAAVPGRPYRLRYTGVAMATAVEPATGTGPSLPAHWKQAVLVVDAQGCVTWIGHGVRLDQLGDVDTGVYWNAGDGWQLIAAVSRTAGEERRITMNNEIDRNALEAKYGKVWSAEELEQEFVATAFIGQTVVVRRKADDVVGTLEFTQRPHLFFNFQPNKGTE